MATQPRLVNKQFNSPIGLYSEQNVREVLQREQQILSNGAIGIDFQHGGSKPSNLQNSAVLRMLEEEEYRQRSGRGGVKRVAWPPQEDEDISSPNAQQSAAPTQGGPQYPSQTPGLQQNNYAQPASYQQQQQSRPLKPLDVNSVSSASPLGSPLVNKTPAGFKPAAPSKRWAPVHSPTATPQYAPQQYQEPGRQYFSQPQSQPVSQQYQTPSQQYPGQQAQQYQAAAPFQQYQAPGQQYQAPQSQQYPAPGQQYQAPPSQQYQAPPSQQYQALPSQPYQAPGLQRQTSAPSQTPQYQSQVSQQSNPPQYFQPAAAQAQAAPRVQSSKPVEPPPSTITLRPQAPVSQAPPPVFSSQPATATLKGGKNLRGDLKWPPENVRQLMEQEKQHLIELSKGPACKPKSNLKDYSPFFEKHALNNTYPGYKIPPGTQFFRPV